MGTLLLLRHGETTFNAAQVFTGLLDAPLAASGEAQLEVASRLVTEAGLRPDVVWQSTMARARRTTDLLLQGCGIADAEIVSSWRLVERAYGCLTGVSKAEARAAIGEEAFFRWRRTVHGRPPDADPATVATWTDPPPVPERGDLPAGLGESLADVIARVTPVWHDRLEPALHAGATVFLIGHGNTLRALAALVLKLEHSAVERLNIGAGHPLVLQVDAARVGEPRYLDPEAALRAASAVAAEGGT